MTAETLSIQPTQFELVPTPQTVTERTQQLADRINHTAETLWDNRQQLGHQVAHLVRENGPALAAATAARMATRAGLHALEQAGPVAAVAGSMASTAVTENRRLNRIGGTAYLRSHLETVTHQSTRQPETAAGKLWKHTTAAYQWFNHLGNKQAVQLIAHAGRHRHLRQAEALINNATTEEQCDPQQLLENYRLQASLQLVSGDHQPTDQQRQQLAEILPEHQFNTIDQQAIFNLVNTMTDASMLHLTAGDNQDLKDRANSAYMAHYQALKALNPQIAHQLRQLVWQQTHQDRQTTARRATFGITATEIYKAPVRYLAFANLFKAAHGGWEWLKDAKDQLATAAQHTAVDFSHATIELADQVHPHIQSAVTQLTDTTNHQVETFLTQHSHVVSAQDLNLPDHQLPHQSFGTEPTNYSPIDHALTHHDSGDVSHIPESPATVTHPEPSNHLHQPSAPRPTVDTPNAHPTVQTSTEHHLTTEITTEALPLESTTEVIQVPAGGSISSRLMALGQQGGIFSTNDFNEPHTALKFTWAFDGHHGLIAQGGISIEDAEILKHYATAHPDNSFLQMYQDNQSIFQRSLDHYYGDFEVQVPVETPTPIVHHVEPIIDTNHARPPITATIEHAPTTPHHDPYLGQDSDARRFADYVPLTETPHPIADLNHPESINFSTNIPEFTHSTDQIETLHPQLKLYNHIEQWANFDRDQIIAVNLNGNPSNLHLTGASGEGFLFYTCADGTHNRAVFHFVSASTPTELPINPSSHQLIFAGHSGVWTDGWQSSDQHIAPGVREIPPGEPFAFVADHLTQDQTELVVDTHGKVHIFLNTSAGKLEYVSREVIKFDMATRGENFQFNDIPHAFDTSIAQADQAAVNS